MFDIEQHTTSTNFDAHMHIDWVNNRAEFASELAQLDITVFGCTCLPQNYIPSSSPYILSAVGFHPWFVQDCDMDVFCEFAKQTPYIGEIGLDSFLPNYDEQIFAFKQVCKAITPGSVLSIHSVRTKGLTLEILKENMLTRTCTILFHSFADDSSTLHDAIKSGCCFSVGERMLSTKRGREYIKQIPMHQLLLESDMPNEPSHITAQDIKTSLLTTLNKIHNIKDGTPSRP